MITTRTRIDALIEANQQSKETLFISRLRTELPMQRIAMCGSSETEEPPRSKSQDATYKELATWPLNVPDFKCAASLGAAFGLSYAGWAEGASGSELGKRLDNEWWQVNVRAFRVLSCFVSLET